ncbi:TMEM175 family protein [Sphingomonas sp. CJ20]
MDDQTEGRAGVQRAEAFSDGVIAIIITIMVLELHAPEEPGLIHLLPLWPVFTAYVLSFAYVAVYWVNHHRLFHHAVRITNSLVWANIALLFALSLVPFATAYLGEQQFSREGTLLYMSIMLLPSFAYSWLQHVIRATGHQDRNAIEYHRRTIRKGAAATIVYAAGIPLTLVSPWLGLGCAAIVAVFWFLPRSRLDDLFAGKA